jgi:hypothetical protein
VSENIIDQGVEYNLLEVPCEESSDDEDPAITLILVSTGGTDISFLLWHHIFLSVVSGGPSGGRFWTPSSRR